MEYKISQVKRILNISEDTLRFFDNKKLINSKRDKKNNYRYFNSNDVNKIFAYKMYRGLLFNMNDSETMISGKPIPTIALMLQNQLEYIKSEQVYMNGVKKHIELLSEKLHNWDEFKGGFEIVTSSNCFYHGNQMVNDFIVDDDIFENSYKCLDSMPDIWPCFCYDLEAESDTLQCSFGYGYYTEGEPPLEGLTHLPSIKCLYTYFTLEDNLMQKVKEILEDAEIFCKKSGYTIYGKSYGNILHETLEGNQAIRLFDFYIPIY